MAAALFTLPVTLVHAVADLLTVGPYVQGVRVSGGDGRADRQVIVLRDALGPAGDVVAACVRKPEVARRFLRPEHVRSLRFSLDLDSPGVKESSPRQHDFAAPLGAVVISGYRDFAFRCRARPGSPRRSFPVRTQTSSRPCTSKRPAGSKNAPA